MAACEDAVRFAGDLAARFAAGRVEGVVGYDLHRLLLSHKESKPLVLAMAEDARLPYSTFLPGFLARALV